LKPRTLSKFQRFLDHNKDVEIKWLFWVRYGSCSTLSPYLALKTFFHRESPPVNKNTIATS
jgi:hypothetical protein